MTIPNRPLNILLMEVSTAIDAKGEPIKQRKLGGQGLGGGHYKILKLLGTTGLNNLADNEDDPQTTAWA